MSSSQQDNVLYDLLRNDDWDEAASRVNTEEGREELKRKDEDGWLPLHEACSFSAPLELVGAMLRGYPEAVRVTDRIRRLPLHHACNPVSGADVSPPVVRLLLDAHPEGAKAADRWGYLPLHIAALNKASLEILTMLIDVHPDGVTIRDKNGRLPLHLLAGKASPAREEDVEKVELLLRPLLDDEDARLVRPDSVIVKVAQRHPEQLREMGEDGSLHLHLAAANPKLNGVLDGQENPIVMLVRLYPDAAAASDGEGRSPLNLAIESSKRWEEGVEAIADAAKGVRTIRDVGTNVFPFMLAASGANPCVTTVYELLRCCPDICKKP